MEEEIKDYRAFGRNLFLVAGLIIPAIILFIFWFILESDITFVFLGAILAIILFLVSLIVYIVTILAYRIEEKNSLK